MEGSTIKLDGSGFFPVIGGIKTLEKGTSYTAFIPNPSVSKEYVIGERSVLNGLCQYHFLMSAGIVRGVLFISPKAHTVVTPVLIKIGLCPGPFKVNTNMQKLGLLLYESPDSSLLIIPSEVSSPLLVEVDT